MQHNSRYPHFRPPPQKSSSELQASWRQAITSSSSLVSQYLSTCPSHMHCSTMLLSCLCQRPLQRRKRSMHILRPLPVAASPPASRATLSGPVGAAERRGSCDGRGQKGVRLDRGFGNDDNAPAALDAARAPCRQEANASAQQRAARAAMDAMPGAPRSSNTGQCFGDKMAITISPEIKK